MVQGATQEDSATEQSGKGTSAAKKALGVTATPSDSQNRTQLRTGRVDAILKAWAVTSGGVDQAAVNGG